jgi:hypothetical protein
MSDVLEAAEKGDVVAVKKYLADGGDPFAYDENGVIGETIAYLGYSNDYPEIARLMVRHIHSLGLDPTIAVADALWMACAQGDLEMVQFLHSHGANIHFRSEMYLKIAKDRQQTPVAEYIANH